MARIFSIWKTSKLYYKKYPTILRHFCENKHLHYKLHKQAKIIVITITELNLLFKQHDMITNIGILGPTCQDSAAIMSRFSPGIRREFTPLHVAGDGNCLFWAVSKECYNTEAYHKELRVRCAAEAIMNKQEYDENRYVDVVIDQTPWCNIIKSNLN